MATRTSQSKPGTLSHVHIATLAAAVALVLASFWAPAARADAAPGDLDASFGDGGIVTTAFISSGGAFATDIAIRSGLIAAVGDHGGGRFALGIYNADGSLAFDRVTTNIGRYDRAEAVAITPGRGIVAAGNSGDRVALARYFSFGALNPSFGGDGKVTTRIEDDTTANAMALQDDGKIVVVGSRYEAGFVGFAADRSITLVRYNADGSLDRSFDGNGIRVIGFDAWTYAQAVAIQRDGKIVVAGEEDNDDRPDRFILARVNPDGSLDRSFSGDGKLATSFAFEAEARALALQGDGKIVVAGRSVRAGGSFALARYFPDGSLDPGFSFNGRVETDIGSGGDRAEAVAIQDDGKIVVAGRTAQGSGNVALARYLPDGALDPSFGDAGRVITGLGGDESASGIAIQVDGRIVIAGETRTGNGRFLLARYHAEPFDDTAPETTISGPNGVLADPEPSFELASAPGATFECELDGAGFAPCSSPHALGPLADGEHTLEARATDGTGNTDATPASHTFTIDTAAPETAIDTGPGAQTSDPTPTFAFSSPEQDVTFECTIDGATFEPCASPLTLDPLTDGPHAFSVRSLDAAGNVDPTPAQRAFTVDTSSPDGGNPPEGGGNPPGGNATGDCPAGTSPSVVCTLDRRGRTTFTGTRRDETFVGTRGRDLMLGRGGDDELRGRGGRDDLRGGPGRDELRGGGGRDSLRGGGGRDRFKGGGGNDRINARGQRRETIRCGGGKRDAVRHARGDRVQRDYERVRR